ncbi:unnamed protein product [Dicrocoelium dendriticum]|nr:unnamed protein product [Dicrocoelium dendriticum]
MVLHITGDGALRSATGLEARWSGWGRWTSCPRSCLSPSHVFELELGDGSSLPLYRHGEVQIRKRQCLFGHLLNCPGGMRAAEEVRNCPPIPACSTGLSCWSPWSSCIDTKPSLTPTSILKVHMHGVRRRWRQCVIGRRDWPNKREQQCTAALEETEWCGYQVESEMDHPNFNHVGNASWSEWTSWSLCEKLHRDERNTIDGEGKVVSWFVRTRVRSCLSIIDSMDHHFFITNEFCLGSWKQLRSCGSTELHAGVRYYPDSARVKWFTSVYLLTVGIVAFTFAALLTCITIMLYHWGYRMIDKNACCKVTRIQDSILPKVKDSTQDFPDHANGFTVPATDTQHDGLHARKPHTMAPLNFSGPPKPILTLPIPVPADSPNNIQFRQGSFRPHTTQTVYDSVASQDALTTPHHPEHNNIGAAESGDTFGRATNRKHQKPRLSSTELSFQPQSNNGHSSCFLHKQLNNKAGSLQNSLDPLDRPFLSFAQPVQSQHYHPGVPVQTEIQTDPATAYENKYRNLFISSICPVTELLNVETSNAPLSQQLKQNKNIITFSKSPHTTSVDEYPQTVLSNRNVSELANTEVALEMSQYKEVRRRRRQSNNESASLRDKSADQEATTCALSEDELCSVYLDRPRNPHLRDSNDVPPTSASSGST